MKNLPDFWRSGVAHPMKEISRLQKGVDRLFEDFLSPSPSWMGGRGGIGGTEEQAATFGPPCDIEETDTSYLVSFDVPGVSKDDVRIELRDNQLVVSGERKEEHREEKSNRLTQERYYGSFMRSFALPPNVDTDKVEADFDEGVLKISIPKPETTKSRQIQIKHGKESKQSKKTA